MTSSYRIAVVLVLALSWVPLYGVDTAISVQSLTDPSGLVEGTSFVAVVSNFVDADPAAVPADFEATINWGDNSPTSVGVVAVRAGGGFTVTGSHTYARFGTYPISTTIKSLTPDAGTTFSGGMAAIAAAPMGGSVQASSTLTVSGIPATQEIADVNARVLITYPHNDALGLVLLGPLQGVNRPLIILANARGGTTADGYANTLFSDQPPATPIGSSTPPFNSANGYAPESPLSALNGRSPLGDWTMQVTNTGPDTGNLQSWAVIVKLVSTATANATAFVADAPLTAAGKSLTSFPTASLSAVMATFTDADPNSTITDFTASINWGDSTTSVGTVGVNPAGGYLVTGKHTYSVHGGYTVKVKITSVGGSTVTATSDVNVVDTTITPTAVTFDATTGATFVGRVAAFTAANAGASANDYTATIAWGDGFTTGGVIADAGSGIFEVRGAHTYTASGNLPVTVDIVNIHGGSASTTSTANVVGPTLTIDDVTAIEGNSGPVSATFIATLSVASSLQASVAYATVDGTATANDGDYQSAMGTLVFEPGETVKTLSVTINGETRVESDETFSIKLSNPNNMVLSRDSATCTIMNDDAGGGSNSGACGVCGGGAGLFSGTTLVAIMFGRTWRRRRAPRR